MASARTLATALYLLSILETSSSSQHSCKVNKADKLNGLHLQASYSTVSVAAIQKFTDTWNMLVDSLLELSKSRALSAHYMAPLNSMLVTIEPAAANVHGLIDSGYLVRSQIPSISA